MDVPIWRRPAWIVLAAAWLTLPVTAGGAIPELLADARATSAGKVAAWIIASAVYGVGAYGILRPGPTALTVLRAGSCGVLVWVAAPSLAALGSGVAAAALLTLAVLLVGLAWTPPVGQACADASAVPGERRFLLASPPGLAYVAGPLAAMVGISGSVAPVLLIAGGFGRSRVLLGLLLAVPGLALTAFLGLALMRLSRRWLVVVPSGLVVHDPVLLDDAYRLAPDEIGAVALTSEGWRQRLAATDVLDATGGSRRALWIGLTRPLAAPGVRPPVRQPKGTIRHVFCAPVLRGEAAAALQAKGYRIDAPVGAP